MCTLLCLILLSLDQTSSSEDVRRQFGEEGRLAFKQFKKPLEELFAKPSIITNGSITDNVYSVESSLSAVKSDLNNAERLNNISGKQLMPKHISDAVSNLTKMNVSTNPYQLDVNRTHGILSNAIASGSLKSDNSSLGQTMVSPPASMRKKRSAQCHGLRCNICPWRSEMLFNASLLPFRFRARVCATEIPSGFDNLVCSPLVVNMPFRLRHCHQTDTDDCTVTVPVSVGCYAAYRYCSDAIAS